MEDKNNIPDYRDTLIDERMKNINYIIMVASGKGGVGKSIISATTSLILAKKGYRIGLLDLDLHGPSSTTIFKINELPEEGREGLIPPEREGVKVMSIDLFAAGRAIPIKGSEKREVIKEVLALTHYNTIDYLIVDMPPETGDILLDSIRYLRGDRGVLLVTAPTILSINVLKRLVEIICDMKIDILGLIINNLMNIEIGKSIQEMLNKIRERYRIPYISETPYDPEASIAVDNGDINRLMDTIFKNRLENIILDIIKQIEQ